MVALPAVARIEGEAGVGKTRLPQDSRGHHAVTVATCQSRREPFPLAPPGELGKRASAGAQTAAPTATPQVRRVLDELHMPSSIEFAPKSPCIAARPRSNLGDVPADSEVSIDVFMIMKTVPPVVLSLVVELRTRDSGNPDSHGR